MNGWNVKLVGISGDNLIKKIYPKNGNNADRSNAGWCLLSGAHLYENTSPQTILKTLKEAKDYESINTNKKIPEYLLYNMVRIGEGVSAEEQEFYKKRLGIEDETNLDKIFAAEQRVIWAYTNNGTKYEDSEIAKKIYDKVQENLDYTSDKEESISISQIDEEKNSFENKTYGMFKITNESGQYIDVKIYESTDEGKNYYNVNEYEAYTEEGTKIEDLGTYNGKFYIKADISGDKVNLKIEVKYYKTVAKYWETEPNDHQPILYIDRTPENIEVETKVAYEPSYGNVSVVLKKVSTGGAGELGLTRIKGTKFKKVYFTYEDTTEETESKALATEELKAMEAGSEDITVNYSEEITSEQDKEDIVFDESGKAKNENLVRNYIIEETEAAEGYTKNPLKIWLSYKIEDAGTINKENVHLYIYNDEDESWKEIERISAVSNSSYVYYSKLYDSTNTIALSVSLENKTEDSTNKFNITFTYTNKPIAYGLNVAKKSAVDGTEAGDYSKALANAVLNVKEYHAGSTKTTRESNITTVEGDVVNYRNDIRIDNIEKADKYVIKETKAPSEEYYLNSNQIVLTVNKALDENGDAYIKSVDVETQDKSGKAIENSRKTLTKEDNKYELNDYEVVFDEKTINVICVDELTTKFKVKVIKKSSDEEGNNAEEDLEGGEFNIYEYDSEYIYTDVLENLQTLDTVESNGETNEYEIKPNSKFYILFEEVTPPEGYKNKIKGLYGYVPLIIDGNGNISINEAHQNYKYNYMKLTDKEDGEGKEGIIGKSNYIKTELMKVETVDGVQQVQIVLVDPEITGEYNFKLTKNDVSGKKIESEQTKFKVEVYDEVKVGAQNEVTYGNKVTLKKTDGTEINTNEITATTGETTALEEIKIESSDIGKTYYYVIEETEAPDDYTKINYKIVVPVEFTEEGETYIATKKEAFAITSDGVKKELTELGTTTNECVSTEQVDTTINVKVPNKEIIKTGEYSVKLIKKGTDGIQLGGVKFTAKATINGASEIDLKTEQEPLITDSGEAVYIGDIVTIDTDHVQTPDVYTLREYDIGDNKGYFIGINKDIKLKVNKTSESINEGSTIRNSVSGIELSIEGETTTNNGTSSSIILSNGSKVTATLEDNVIILTVENPEVTEIGNYNVKLIKTVTDGTLLAGVKFTTEAEINGTPKVDLYTKESPLVTEMTAVSVGNPVKIDTNNISIPDKYTFKEIDIGNNSGYYIGITQDIVLTVNKKSEKSSDGSTITNSVSGIELSIDGINVEKNSETKSTATTTINGEEVQVTAELINDTITLTVENPTVKKEGEYSIKLIKKGTDGKKLGGVKFTAKAIINGAQEKDLTIITDEENPVNIIDAVTINADEGSTSDVYTLSESDIGDNSGYYIGITQDIVLTVNKKAEKSSDGSTITNSVSGINLQIQGANITKNSETKSTAKITVDGKELNVVAELNGSTITITVENPLVTGKFNMDLIKYVKNTKIPLSGAEFTISIKDENGKELADTAKKYITGDDGYFKEKISGIKIDSANKTYTITIKETTVPQGYKGINNPITFEAKSKLSEDKKSYILEPKEITTLKNAKKTTIEEEKILVEAENTPEGPHKGVKEVYNQNSGYYDEVTGAVYKNKEEIESTVHDWVITSRIPSGISKYGKYILTDKIDDRLNFSGEETVKVLLLNGETLEKVKELTKDTDYKVNYDQQTKTLKISFIEGNFTAGRNLTEGSIVEIRFNTTFAKDEDGHIIAINQSVSNKATLTYGDNNRNDVSKDTETPEVHTGGVGLYKYDNKTGKALSGAKFKIATTEDNAKNGIFVKDVDGNDIEKITNEKGIAVFEGLEFGEDAMKKVEYKTGETIYGQPVYKYDWEKVQTTYYIVETESPEGYSKIEKPIEAVVKKDNYDVNDIESLIKVGNDSNIYDLSLRKFITGVKDGATGDEKEITTRIPDVDTTPLIDKTETTAKYEHTKEPVLVHTTDTVTYTIRVYNEGSQDAYASLIKDDIPKGLEFVQYTEGDGSINATYGWKLVDENDVEVTDISKAKYIITDYLAKDSEEKNLIKGFNKDTMSELDYRDVKVQFKVLEPNTSDRVIINYAQISEETNSNGDKVTDRDSTPNEWKGEDDEDIEKIRVLYFDLALRKWVTQAIVTENGQTYVTETGHKAEDDPEEVVKVDLKKSKLNDVTVKFKYSIRITNEGEIAGEATEISDYIPDGLKFVQEDNPDWREEDGKVVTNKLAGTTLQPGESAEVEILLTWVNSESNMGVMINTAEISKDHNNYGTPDIDSTPNNKVPGEDDIDDAPVMLTIKTGAEIIGYTSIALGFIAIIILGVNVIKRKV